MNYQAQSIAKTLLDDKRSLVDEVKRAKKILNYKRLFDESDYYESNRGLYHAAIILAFISQLATAYSSYNFYAKFETFIILNELKPFVISIILIGIEVIKFMLCQKSIPTIFTKPQPMWLILSAIVVLITIYTSILGGGNLGVNDTKTINVSNNFNELKSKTINDYDLEIKNVAKDYDKTINDLREVSERSSKSFWVTSSAKAVAKANDKITDMQTKKEEALSKLRAKKELEINSLSTKNDNNLEKIEKENKASETAFRIGFGVFDLLFMLCTYFTYLYKHESKEREEIHELEKESVVEPVLPIEKIVSVPQEVVEIEVDNFSKSNNVESKNKPAIGFQLSNNKPTTKIVEPKPILNVSNMNEKIVYVDRVVEKIVYVPQETIVEKEVPATKRYCEFCDTQYPPNAKKNRFCSDKCRNHWHDSFGKLKKKMIANKPLDDKDIKFETKLKEQQKIHYNKLLQDVLKSK